MRTHVQSSMYILDKGMDVLTLPDATTCDKKYLTPLFLDHRKKMARSQPIP